MNMKSIRKFATRTGAVAICSAMLCAGSLVAQGRGMMSSDDRVAAIDKAVTLTADQKTKIKAMYDEDMKKMMALRESQDPDMRTKMMAMRTDENTKIKALLTDDQKPKFDAYVAAQPMGRMGGGPPPQQ